MASRMKKACGSLDAGRLHMQEIAVIQGLQAKVVELGDHARLLSAAPRRFVVETAAAFRPAASLSTPF